MAGQTWSTVDKDGNITLSNGNLTATTSSVTQGGVRATYPVKPGRKYFYKVEITDGTGVAVVGIASRSWTRTTVLGNNDFSLSYLNGGNVRQNNTTITTLETWTTGDVISVAVDYDNDKVWFKKNNGNWNNSATANPATNTEGITLGISGGDLYPAAGFNTTGQSYTLDFLDSVGMPDGFVLFPDTTRVTTTGGGSFTIPAGVEQIEFEAWGGGGAGAANKGAGGGGGAYIAATFSVTEGDIIYWNIGATADQPTNTWFKKNSNSSSGAWTAASGLSAPNGRTGGSPTNGTDGGTLLASFTGGDGAAAQDGGGSRGGSGGGGCAGPYGNAASGTVGSSSTGGGGGGGNSGWATGGAGGTSGNVGSPGFDTENLGGGGGGGGGANAAAGAGGAPGGGGGGSGSSSGSIIRGATGQIRYSYSVAAAQNELTSAGVASTSLVGAARAAGAASSAGVSTPSLVGAGRNAGALSSAGSATPSLVGQAVAQASLDQAAFRFRADDGGETTATYFAALNTNVTLFASNAFRLRFLIDETNGAAVSTAYKLQFRRNGGAWTDCDTANNTTAVYITSSVHYTDGAATTQQLGAGTFVAGTMEEDNTGSAISLNNSETEIEYNLRFDSEQVFDNDSIDLRLVRANGTPLNTYTNTPNISIDDPAFTQSHFRFRFDDGSETTANWMASANVGNLRFKPTDKFRLRFGMNNSGSISGQVQGRLEARVNGGNWFFVGDATPSIRTVASANFTNDSLTTQQLTTGTFVAGRMIESSPASDTSVDPGARTEYEFMLEVQSGLVAGDTVDFRCIQSNNDPFDTYTVTPSILIDEVRSGALASSGLATPALVGRGVNGGAISSAGLATPSLVGFSLTLVSGSLGSAGVGATSLVGRAVGAGAFSATAVATPNLAGGARNSAAFSVAGVGATSLTSNTNFSAVISSVGAASANMLADNSTPAELTAAGTSTAAFQSAEGVGELVVTATAAFLAEGSSTDAGAFSGSGNVTVSIIGRQVESGLLSAAGQSNTLLEGNPVGPQIAALAVTSNAALNIQSATLANATYSIAGIGTTELAGVQVTGGGLVSQGQAAGNLLGGGVYGSALTSAGFGLADFVPEPPILTSAGLATVSFVGRQVASALFHADGEAELSIIIIPFVPTGTPEYRVLEVSGQNRILNIKPMSRDLRIPLENRDLIVKKGAD